jgi:hypothetical protein
MPASTHPAGVCPKCGGDAVLCRYNFFDRGDLQVHSWEHKCGNCGWRQTQAFRSDAPAAEPATEPGRCPWCARLG